MTWWKKFDLKASLLRGKFTQTLIKILLGQSHVTPAAKLINSFTKYIDSVVKKHSFSTYTLPESSKQIWKVIYCTKLFNPCSIPTVFKLKAALWKAQSELEDIKASFSSCMTPQKLRQMIKKQASFLPVGLLITEL